MAYITVGTLFPTEEQFKQELDRLKEVVPSIDNVAGGYHFCITYANPSDQEFAEAEIGKLLDEHDPGKIFMHVINSGALEPGESFSPSPNENSIM